MSIYWSFSAYQSSGEVEDYKIFLQGEKEGGYFCRYVCAPSSVSFQRISYLKIRNVELCVFLEVSC